MRVAFESVPVLLSVKSNPLLRPLGRPTEPRRLGTQQRASAIWGRVISGLHDRKTTIPYVELLLLLGALALAFG